MAEIDAIGKGADIAQVQDAVKAGKLGVVLIGRPGEEAKLLSYANALEQATKLRVDPDLDATLAQIDPATDQ